MANPAVVLCLLYLVALALVLVSVLARAADEGWAEDRITVPATFDLLPCGCVKGERFHDPLCEHFTLREYPRPRPRRLVAHSEHHGTR